MSLLSNVFKRNDEPIKSNEEFWEWFKKNERTFFKVVKEKRNIEKEFFDKISPKLNQLKAGFFYLTGMFNTNTVELVLTADGAIENIPFVEELVKVAPKIDGWMFTSLKPALDIKNMNIRMAGYIFSSENISFYADDHLDFPDEIDVTIIHEDMNEQNKTAITNGIYIFLDNFLGELNFATTIDNIKITGKNEAIKELIPIEKLKSFLIWRQSEFVEKYKGIKRDTEHDGYSMLEAELSDGKRLLAVINTALLDWDSKASHPWILKVEMSFDGSENNGMPDDETYERLDRIENEILEELKDFDGYLNIGRQTADGVREIYFACKDFRKPSTVLYKIKQKYSPEISLDYNIYKDKYWQSFDRFMNE